MTSYQLDRANRTLKPYITGGKPEHDEKILVAIAERLLEARYPPDEWDPIHVSDDLISYKPAIDAVLQTILPIRKLDVESIRQAPIIYEATIYSPLGKFKVQDGFSFTALFEKITEVVRNIENLEFRRVR